MVRVVVDEESQVETRKRRELERYRAQIALKGSRGHTALAKITQGFMCMPVPSFTCLISKVMGPISFPVF